MTLRLLTLNLQHGRPAAVGRRGHGPGFASPGTVRRTAEQIAHIGADVVLLQEVDVHQARSAHVDQARLLADELGWRAVRHASTLIGSADGLRVPAWTSDVTALNRRLGLPRRGLSPLGGYGVAVLSRLPVRSWHVLPLPGAGLRWRAARGAAPSIAGRRPVLDPRRVCLAAVLRTPDGPLTVATTHLSVHPPTARDQLRRTVRALRLLPGPPVLGGDLNLGPDAAAALTGLVPLATGATFPRRRPRTQIDHLLGGPGVTVAGPGVVHLLDVSDHAGLSADVRLEPVGPGR